MEQWINNAYENWADKDKVDLELQPIVANDSDYTTKIQVEMQDKDTCPDIFFEDTFQLNTDVAAGYVADITDKVILSLMLPGVCTVGIYTFSG